MSAIKVLQVNVFPFKSLKGISVNEWPVDEHGFRYDRVYMLTYESHQGKLKAITQREEPTLALIETQLSDDDTLTLSYPSKNGVHERASLPLDITTLPADMPTRNMELFGYDMVVSDVGAVLPQVRDFFRKYLKQDKYKSATVVASNVRRHVPDEWAHTHEFIASEADHTVTANFQDYWPGTLMTTASFEDLENHVKIITENTPISMKSFRMNMIVETDEPWAEDDWRRITIGGHEWFVDSPVPRCPITTVDQDTGAFREQRQPLPALWKYRVLRKGSSPAFGLNLVNKHSGFTIKVGDSIEVLETADFTQATAI